MCNLQRQRRTFNLTENTFRLDACWMFSLRRKDRLMNEKKTNKKPEQLKRLAALFSKLANEMRMDVC